MAEEALSSCNSSSRKSSDLMSEMSEAALQQQHMEMEVVVSDEEICRNSSKRRRRIEDIVMAKIQEIFGEDQLRTQTPDRAFENPGFQVHLVAAGIQFAVNIYELESKSLIVIKALNNSWPVWLLRLIL
ncbi:lipoprotein [Sesbania bispinosa]|nr:lipoprotein [Sesbania bispinosa]